MSDRRPNTTDRAKLARGMTTEIRPRKFSQDFTWALKERGALLEAGYANSYEEADRISRGALRRRAREPRGLGGLKKTRNKRGARRQASVAKPKPRKVTTVTKTTRVTTLGVGLGDLLRSQEEHIDAMHVAIEDGDCKRAARELAEAKSHGPVRHVAIIEKQLRQHCPLGGDLGRLTGRRSRRGRGSRPPRHIQLPADAYVPDKPPLPWLVYALGYGAAALVGFKILSRGKAFAASGLGGCASCPKGVPCRDCSRACPGIVG